MASLLEAAAPKSDQLNACDFLVESKTYTIRDVVVKKDGEQRVSVFFEGCALPWKPCKSMLRVMMVVWNSFDGKDFIGKSLTLFNDEKVMWAGAAVGGIRISHMSGLTSERTIPLRATKKTCLNYVVKPLAEVKKQEKEDVQENSSFKEGEASRLRLDFAKTAKELKEKLVKLHQDTADSIIDDILAADNLQSIKKQWYNLCAEYMGKSALFSVPDNVAEKMHELLGLKKPLSITKGYIDYGADDIVYLDELLRDKQSETGS